jgi:hypothetical protein
LIIKIINRNKTATAKAIEIEKLPGSDLEKGKPKYRLDNTEVTVTVGTVDILFSECFQS